MFHDFSSAFLSARKSNETSGMNEPGRNLEVQSLDKPSARE